MLAFPPDYTFFIQLVSFFVLLFVLNRLLFVPFGELLADRARSTDGAREQASRDQADVAALSSAITKALEQARAIALAEADVIRRETRQRELAILNDAKTEAAVHLARLRDGMTQERDRAKAALRDEAKTLAHAMVEAVLRPQSARALQ
jgi:F-type H+-transporting ATPase subunit b